jgi:hypothetical protein
VNNKNLLKQKRIAQTELINIMPESMTVNVPVMVSDGFGGTIPDPAGTTDEVTIKYRVFHEQSGPAGLSESPGGLSTNLLRAIMSDWKNDLTAAANGTITSAGKNYRIGVVDTLQMFGGVFGYQAPLIEES